MTRPEKANTEQQKNGKEGRRPSMPFRALDLIIIAAVLAVSLCPLLFLPKSKGGKTVVITWHGEEIYRGDIEKDASVTTPDGLNTVVISGGSVHMEAADCRDHICIRSGEATPAHPIVCLPNRVVVTVIGSEEVDSVSW